MKKVIYISMSVIFLLSTCKKEEETSISSNPNSPTYSSVENLSIDTNYLSYMYNFMVKLDSGTLDSIEFDTAMFNLEASINAAIAIRDTNTMSGVFTDSLKYSTSIFVDGEGGRRISGDNIESLFNDMFDDMIEKLENATMPGDQASEGKYVKGVDIVWGNSSSTTQDVNVYFHYTGIFPLASGCTFTDDWYASDQGGCGSNSGSSHKVTDFMDVYLNMTSCNDDKNCFGILVDGSGGTKVLFSINVVTISFNGYNYPTFMYSSLSQWDCLTSTEILDYADGSNLRAQSPSQLKGKSFSFNFFSAVQIAGMNSYYVHVLKVEYGDCVLMEVPFSRTDIVIFND